MAASSVFGRGGSFTDIGAGRERPVLSRVECGLFPLLMFSKSQSLKDTKQ
jgi:hypothetical protein